MSDICKEHCVWKAPHCEVCPLRSLKKMKIESRALFKYPVVAGDSGKTYTENEVSTKERKAYIKGAQEQREEDARNVSLIAMTVYEFFDLQKKDMNKEAFVDAFRNIILEE